MLGWKVLRGYGGVPGGLVIRSHPRGELGFPSGILRDPAAVSLRRTAEVRLADGGDEVTGATVISPADISAPRLACSDRAVPARQPRPSRPRLSAVLAASAARVCLNGNLSEMCRRTMAPLQTRLGQFLSGRGDSVAE